LKEIWDMVEPIDGYDHLCMSSSIVVFCYWSHFLFSVFFVVGGVSCVFLRDHVVDYMRFIFWFLC